MEMHQIRYFLAICRTGNFTRAAELCNVTQPALTRAVMRLEEELGGPLLLRDHKQTRLTPLGELMRPLLEQTHNAAESAKQQAAVFRRHSTSSLGLGLSFDTSPGLLIEPINELREKFPGFELALAQLPTDMLFDRLEEGEIEALVVAGGIDLPERFHRWPIYIETFLLAMPSGHRLASQPAIRPADLQDEIWIDRPYCAASRGLIETYRKAGIELRVRHTTTSDGQAQPLIAAGFGITVLPSSTPRLSGIELRPIEGETLTQPVLVTTRAGRPLGPVPSAFLRLVRARDWSHVGPSPVPDAPWAST